MISSFLSSGDVVFGARISDKAALLREIANRTAANVGLSEESIFLELMRREKLGSTGMGGGYALPHARIAELEKPIGLVVRLAAPIEFESIDGKPVDLVFALLMPVSDENANVASLATVARKLRNRDAVAKIRAARDGQSLYEQVIAPE